MTDEYLQFSIPSVPYSAVRIPIVADLQEQDEWVARAMNAAQLLANAYHIAFAEPFPENPPDPAPHPASAEGFRFNPANNGKPKGTGLYCPDHPHIEVLQSADQYQQWDEGPNGEKIPAKFFCPGRENGTGKNHSLWRSKLRTEPAVPV